MGFQVDDTQIIDIRHKGKFNSALVLGTAVSLHVPNVPLYAATDSKSEESKEFLEQSIKYRLDALWADSKATSPLLEVKIESHNAYNSIVTLSFFDDHKQTTQNIFTEFAKRKNDPRLVVTFEKNSDSNDKTKATVSTAELLAYLAAVPPTPHEFFYEWQARFANEPSRSTAKNPTSLKQVYEKAMDSQKPTFGNKFFKRQGGRTAKCLTDMGCTVTSDDILDNRHKGEFSRSRADLLNLDGFFQVINAPSLNKNSGS